MKPDIDASQIETLKKRLLGDADLGDFWNYYFTEIVEHPNFVSMGRVCQNATVVELLSAVGQSISGRSKPRVKNMLLIEIPSYQLIHGSCLLDGRIASVLYFPQMKAGVIAVAVGPGGQMAYARIQEPALENLNPASTRAQ